MQDMPDSSAARPHCHLTGGKSLQGLPFSLPGFGRAGVGFADTRLGKRVKRGAKENEKEERPTLPSPKSGRESERG
jgi:hypothetical protein